MKCQKPHLANKGKEVLARAQPLVLTAGVNHLIITKQKKNLTKLMKSISQDSDTKTTILVEIALEIAHMREKTEQKIETDMNLTAIARVRRASLVLTKIIDTAVSLLRTETAAPQIAT